MTLPTDYANTTPSADTHPAAHNDTNAAVNALDTEVDALGAAVNAVDARNRMRRGAAGHWIWALEMTTTPTNAAMANRHIRMARIYVGQPFNAAVFEVTAAVAASTARVVIYATGADGMPTSLAVPAPTAVATATVGHKVATFTAVPAGVYWAGLITTQDISVRCLAYSMPQTSWVSSTTTAPAATEQGGESPELLPALSTTYNGWQQYLGDGVLPAPFTLPNPTWGSATDVDMVPVLMLRLA